jgi:hypothetical protein
MSAFFYAVLLLSAAAFIHSKSSIPEMRPDSPAADIAWRWLSRAALLAWGTLLAWGFSTRGWTEPLAALLASIGLNIALAARGPRPAWPGLSMLCAVAGLGLAAYSAWASTR